MTKTSPKALVLSGDGINCERETAHACALAGFTAEIRSVNELVESKFSQDALEQTYRLVVLPGGFSFGDELGSGRVLALKIRHGLGWDFSRFTRQGGLVLGVCNGFQALIRLGAFGTDVSIAQNASGKFLNTWATLSVANDGVTSPWLKGLPRSFELPIRHGEGRILTETPESLAGKQALQYVQDVNGSDLRTAGLVSADGRILGLMPHPEAFVRATQRPDWTSAASEPAGLKFFENAYATVTESKRTIA